MKQNENVITVFLSKQLFEFVKNYYIEMAYNEKQTLDLQQLFPCFKILEAKLI